MTTFIVTIRDGHKRRRFVTVARGWFEAWTEAANEYGKAVILGVRPIRHQQLRRAA